MGELLHGFAAGGRVRSLNGLFNATQFEATRRLVKILRVQYGPLLKGPPNNPANEHRRRKRLRSLRFAATLLNDDIAFKPPGYATDPSDGQLRHWLRWLTWLEQRRAAEATMTENGGVPAPLPGPPVVQPSPHDLITRTIAAALDDDDAASIVFDWTDRNALSVAVDWDYVDVPVPAGQTRTYRITVISKRSSHPDVRRTDPEDGDNFDPEP